MRSIRTKITTVTVSVLVIVMAFATVFGVAAIRNIGNRSAEQTLLLMCETGQKNLNHYLMSVEQSVEMVSAYVESDLDGLDDAHLQAHLDRVGKIFQRLSYKTDGMLTYYYRIDPDVSQAVKGFWYVNLDGEGFQAHEVTDITLYDTQDTSSLVWFTVPKTTGQAVWLPPYITDNLDVRVISYNVPVYFERQFVGVIGIEIDYSMMAEEVNHITLYDNGYAFINDAEGKIIYHPHMDVATMETQPDVPDGLLSDSQFIRYVWDGVEKMAVCLPLCNGVRLNVAVPIREINAVWKSWIITIVIVFCALLAAFIAVIMRFAGRITRPLRELTQVAEQIDEGNYDHTLEYDGNDEIGVLTRTFGRASANLKSYITDLNDLTRRLTLQKESLSALLDNMPALNFSKDAETGAYLYCNQGFAEYTHRATPADVVGLTDFDIFDRETAAHFAADDRRALSMDAPYVFFEDVLDAEGTPRQFRTTKMKFHDSTGRLCLLGMCMDVTELERIRRESEQTQAAYQEALTTSAIYENVVDALSEDYFDIYYVDVETGEYIEYGAWTEEGKRTNEKRGADFFAETRGNAPNYIHEEDLERFMASIEKEKLLGEIKRHGALILHYRLLINGVPTYVSMKATRISGDDRHIIIGVSNVDSQVKDRMAAEHAREERKTYKRLSALNGNLIVLYFVDPDTEQYVEFSSTRAYENYGIAKQGAGFFDSIYANSLKTVHPEDQTLVQSQLTKKNVLEAIRQDGVFVMNYRLLIGDVPSYVRLKAAMIDEDGKPNLIIGVFDEDAQVRQEQEYARNLSAARRMATIDSLTGIKNKHAYAQWEEKINEKIGGGAQEPFAVVVCDVNNLKAVNDLYGHKEGDACIRNACAKICKVFDHSPVFRIGGDEFVVLLSGDDYSRREALMEQINAVPEDRTQIRIGATIASGMAEYDKYRHYSLLSVFEEADKAMYERKQALKESFQSEGQAPGGQPDPEYIPVINTRKRILIVDDIEMNREIMGDLLQDDYDILYASDGIEALQTLRSHSDEIDLVLLDLQMPNMNGREVIAEMQVDEDLMGIPVVFLTVDQAAELDCLKIGAMDFIPKPYPDIEIVKARIDKCIELSEDRDLIRNTERDKLTGLLNKDYFLRYVNRLDQVYKNTKLDAVVCDVNRFHSVNKQYGRQFGDLVLRSIGLSLRKLARKTGGIGCRQGGDTFLLYCPHQDDYEPLLREFLSDVFAEAEIAGKVGIRFGVFTDARQAPEIEERFERAKIAADRVKDDPEAICGFYEDS